MNEGGNEPSRGAGFFILAYYHAILHSRRNSLLIIEWLFVPFYRMFTVHSNIAFQASIVLLTEGTSMSVQVKDSHSLQNVIAGLV